jgi:hypothetical protein
MNNRLNQLLYLLKGYFGLYLSISLGVFMFVLFFQPFPLDRFDFNNRLIFVAGLGTIIFLLMGMIRIAFSLLFQRHENAHAKPLLSPFFRGFVLFTLSSVAFAFYLRYVGGVLISFYIMLKVLLICMAAPVVLRIFDHIGNLKKINESMGLEKKALQKQIEKYEADYLNKSIDFISENGTETVNLMIRDVAFIRSADNYVEIVYQEAETFKKKLIRNTMKNIEQQLKNYANFIRCHRVCIVNTYFVEKLDKNSDNHLISIKGYTEKIPVSRQYLLKLRDMI